MIRGHLLTLKLVGTCVLSLLTVATVGAEPQGLPTIKPMRGTGELGRPEDPQKYTFVVFGDNRPGEGEPQPETIHEIVAEISMLRPLPAFAISLGDIIEGKDPEDTDAVIKAQFNDFLAIARRAGVPIYNAPGNHEMDDSNDVPSERMHRLYEQWVAPSYGAFDYGNARFICLNTENVPPAGAPPPEPPLEFSYLSDKQLEELRADLDASRNKSHIFIAMHYPVKPMSAKDALNPTDRMKLETLLSNYKNISYVLAAHEHIYYNPQDAENVTTVPGFTKGDATLFLVSGGAGAPLWGDPNWAFHHYLVFTVDGDQVSVELVKLQGSGAKS